MRRILNYLLGEELVSKQSDKAIYEAVIAVVVMWMAIIVSMLFMQVIR